MAPYGAYAQNWMMDLQLWDLIKHKVVYAASVSQANQFIYSGNVDVAFTSASAIPLISKGNFQPISQHEIPIYHTLSIIGDPHRKEIKEVRHFLQSESSRMLFREYGFQLVNPLPQSASR